MRWQSGPFIHTPVEQGLQEGSMFPLSRLVLPRPCVNVPGLADEDGLPLGVQIVGRFGRDKRMLEVALFLERALERALG
jgi:Asp-tRNA(Asn)/Glu-tRNA(Gln) amidotransferase A subunit family amidase